MLNKRILTILLIALLSSFILGTGLVLAQTLQTTNTGRVEQVFALTTSQEAVFSNPSGAFQPLESMTIDLKADSMLVITFSARGVVAPSGGPSIPIVFVKCEIDGGSSCQPNTNAVEFLYPQFCCDTRSFTWIVHAAGKGIHTIAIHWGMGNPTFAIITNRAVVVEAARP